jgi:hypothetical protein
MLACMPVEGLPDPAVHKRCCRCGQWFDEMDGDFVERPRHGVGGAILAIVDRIVGDPRLEFVCDGCASLGSRGGIVLVVALAIAAIGIAAWLLL